MESSVLEKGGVSFSGPDVSRLEFDAKAHAYKLDGRLLSGVTSVIDGTSSKQNLIDWAARLAAQAAFMIAAGMKVSALALLAEELAKYPGLTDGDAEKIERLFPVFRDARKAHTKKKEDAGTKGTDTHALVEEYINSCIDQVGGVPALLPLYKEVLPFKEWAQANVDRFIAAEQKLYSETHGFAGTCDFVAVMNGKLTIGDLKTFPKMWSADAFIQMGAYSICWRELTGERPAQSVVVKMCDPEDPRIKKYGNKPFAVYPRYSLAEDEEMFLTRLKVYRYNQNFSSPKE